MQRESFQRMANLALAASRASPHHRQLPRSGQEGIRGHNGPGEKLNEAGDVLQLTTALCFSGIGDRGSRNSLA